VAGVVAGADIDAGADVGEYGCEDARSVRDCVHGDVGSLLSCEVAVKAVHVNPGEGESDGGCVRADVGASENEGEGTDCHVLVHTTAVQEGDVHLGQEARDLIPK
jgi:hypothetical protein